MLVLPINWNKKCVVNRHNMRFSRRTHGNPFLKPPSRDENIPEDHLHNILYVFAEHDDTLGIPVV